MPDNLRHAQYDSAGTQIDNPVAIGQEVCVLPTGALTTPTAVVRSAVQSAAERSVADRFQPWSLGTQICDFTGTFTVGAGSGIATGNSPDGSNVAFVNGDAVNDGVTGNPGNNYGDIAINTVATKDLKSLGVWLRCDSRNTARKNYRNVPVKLLLSQDGTFTNYMTVVINVRADGKWHFYIVTTASPNAGYTSFVLGTNTFGLIRVRASIDSACNDSALLGTAPLRTGEVVYFGGIYKNPRCKPLAMIRFDDCNDNLYSNKLFSLSVPYVGQSGVTVPAGNYTAYDLVTAFGHKAACFILTRYIDAGSPFESKAGLLALQKAGWEICFQTHYNPVDTLNSGARLLGTLGFPWTASAVMNYAVDGTITSGSNTNFVLVPGQGIPITLIGTPPAPLAAGQTVWARPITATTFRVFRTESDSLANSNPITFAAASSATFGWNYAYATADATGVNNDFRLGIAAMQAAGFNGWMHWAPNQGAVNQDTENAWYANNMQSCFGIGYNSAPFGLGMPSQFNFGLGLTGYVSYIPTMFTGTDAYATDNGTEANARLFVQAGIKLGTLISNYHHLASGANTLVLCAYLDELKLRQDRGELEVATPTRIVEYMNNMRIG